MSIWLSGCEKPFKRAHFRTRKEERMSVIGILAVVALVLVIIYLAQRV
ncbi:MAG: hypothetical protein MPW15_25920 [Candidatus Manganitrophus sp.]|nr:hypothetical protein [Candidatus Manganitrophus sp.]